MDCAHRIPAALALSTIWQEMPVPSPGPPAGQPTEHEITSTFWAISQSTALPYSTIVAKFAPEILYAVYVAFILANLILIPFGILAIKGGSQMLRVPRNMLMPAILMFCVVGSFAINNTTFDVGIMLGTGILAYFMEANDIPVAPAVLGIVLGRLLEDSFMVSMIKSEWDLTVFFHRPVSAVLGVITIFLWASPFIGALRARRRKK